MYTSVVERFVIRSLKIFFTKLASLRTPEIWMRITANSSVIFCYKEFEKFAL